MTSLLFYFGTLVMANQPTPGVVSSISGADQVLVKAVDPFAEDPLANGVPGARVVLINTNTSATDTLLTNSAGEALFTIDPAGSYEVKILDGPIPLPLQGLRV
ncbi:MAG: carboxypeptidase regulatory-like domain-containing protein [Saprospiraceae bacterium]|nr:carboxypeptidase regulatory-like domain-containing protein [Saprospiraceae bacterium]